MRHDDCIVLFKREAFKEGYILAGRNNKDAFAKMIRIGVKSTFGNHTATSAYSHDMEMGFNEAMPPESKHTSLDEYERMMNEDGYEVRIYRIKGISDLKHAEMARYFRENLLGVPYPKKLKMALLASRIYNLMYDNIPGMKPWLQQRWCTKLSFLAARAIAEACLDRPDGKRKMQPTPKTVENLIAWGVLEDVTDKWLKYKSKEISK